jgi:predicted permease
VASAVTVGEAFFETMGLSLVEGRLLQSEDHLPGALGNVVVDQAAADRWWPGESPVGQNVRFGRDDGPWSRVVGVVSNMTYDGPGEEWPTFYNAHSWTAEGAPFIARSAYLTVRTREGESPVIPAIRQIVRELNPNLAIANTYTMEGIMDRAVARPRFIMSVLSLFAGVALILGAIGIYGVLAYGVALRAGEIGIRRALGAQGGDMVRMILKQGLWLTGVGLAVGLAASLVGTRILSTFLYGVSPTDPITFGAVVAGILLVAFLASYLPARRASGVDPLEALRVE